MYFLATCTFCTPRPCSAARVHVDQVFLAVDGWAKAWKRREATRGTSTNFAVFGRSPPPAVAEQSRQTSRSSSTNRSSSSSRSVKKTLSAADLPPSKKVQPQEAQDTQQRERGGNGGRSGAEDTNHSRLERQNGTNTNGCASGAPAVAPLPMKATAAAAAAAARKRAEEEQQPSGKRSTLAAAAAGPNASSRGTHSEDITVAPSSPGSSRSTSPTFTFTAGTVSAVSTGGVGTSRTADQLSAPVVGENSRKGAVGETVCRVLQRRASGSAGGKERQGGWVGGMAQRPASFSHPPPPPESSAVVCGPGSSGAVTIDVSVGAGEEAMSSMPDEERAFVDELLMEIRLPLISTSFLCQGAACVGCRVRRLRATPILFFYCWLLSQVFLFIGFVNAVAVERRIPKIPTIYVLLLGLSGRIRFVTLSYHFRCGSMHAFSRSSSCPAAVVEKSPAITGSKVAQRLLLEAYRFQAMTSTDAVDVDEHFPGNHRVKVSAEWSRPAYLPGVGLFTLRPFID